MLNKQSDNIQPWHTPFPMWKQSFHVLFKLLLLSCIEASQESGQLFCYPHLFQNSPKFIIIHTVKVFGIMNKADVHPFLEPPCFIDDPADAGHLISASSDFSKNSLNLWKFMVHVLLKHGWKKVWHYFTSVWDECNCALVWAFFALPFFGIGMKTDLFQSRATAEFFKFADISSAALP